MDEAVLKRARDVYLATRRHGSAARSQDAQPPVVDKSAMYKGLESLKPQPVQPTYTAPPPPIYAPPAPTYTPPAPVYPPQAPPQLPPHHAVEAQLIGERLAATAARTAAEEEIARAGEEARRNAEFEKKQQMLEQAARERQLEEGSRMTLAIIESELDREKKRILNALRLAYRSEVFQKVKKGEVSHEEFELELLRLLREEKLELVATKNGDYKEKV